MMDERKRILHMRRPLAVAVGLGLVVLLALGAGWLTSHFRASGPAAQTAQPGSPTPPPSLTRAEVLSLAECYVTHQWNATPAHSFHGIDPDGIRVDTPDSLSTGPDRESGWWVTTGVNIGIPYKWGGFDLPEEFDAGLRTGLYAGDAYSAEKRRLLDDAVSRHAVGIDCSGLVSRCWRLPRSYSTRELPSLCDPITDMSRLRPGDIFNRHNAHVRLFAGWTDSERTRVNTYEATDKVRRQDYSLDSMLAQGYSAWRYRGLAAE
jgi:hypothetical protein